MSKEKEILKEVGESPQYRLFEFFLQEHGITLLEGQMHDIIHEVQLYLDATNDNPVVQQSLTTESMKCYICKKELKGYGYESPLDGERVCENCFSRDQYVNDNTDWDNSVVKENLTSEKNLITAKSPQLKTPEEKAIEEAETMISEYANNSHISREYYAEGYLSGFHSRDEEVKELREALGEAISLICQGTEYEVGVKPYVDFAAQAKQLLNKQ